MPCESAEASNRPGPNATASPGAFESDDASGAPAGVRVAAFQRRTFPSSPIDASSLPSWLNATSFTAPSVPRRNLRIRPAL